MFPWCAAGAAAARAAAVKFAMELRVSGEKVCVAALAEALRELGEAACVAPTLCVVPQDGGFRVEPGAHVLLPDADRARLEALWPELKRRFGLSCGWLDASRPGFRGCTENYLRPSLCPSHGRPLPQP